MFKESLIFILVFAWLYAILQFAINFIKACEVDLGDQYKVSMVIKNWAASFIIIQLPAVYISIMSYKKLGSDIFWGRILDVETLGYWHYIIIIGVFTILFAPMWILGLRKLLKKEVKKNG